MRGLLCGTRFRCRGGRCGVVVTECWLWSVPLATMGLVGQYLAGRRSWWGWVVGLFDEALWIAYAIGTRQWMFAGSALVYSWIYMRNLCAWRAGSTPTRAASRRQHRAGSGTRRVGSAWAAASWFRRPLLVLAVPVAVGLAGCAYRSADAVAPLEAGRHSAFGTAVVSRLPAAEVTAGVSARTVGAVLGSRAALSAPARRRPPAAAEGRPAFDGPVAALREWARVWCPYDYRQSLARHAAAARPLMSRAGWAGLQPSDQDGAGWTLVRRDRLVGRCAIGSGQVLPAAPRSPTTAYVQVSALRRVVRGDTPIGVEAVTYRRRVVLQHGRWLVDRAVEAG